jgi:uncharacterized protein YkwD
LSLGALIATWWNDSPAPSTPARPEKVAARTTEPEHPKAPSKGKQVPEEEKAAPPAERAPEAPAVQPDKGIDLADDLPEDLAVRMEQAINAARRRAGLWRVVLDDNLSRGCMQHARYLARNAGHSVRAGSGLAEESADRPGYSPEGQTAARQAVSEIGKEPLAIVHAWMASAARRVPLLDPTLKRIGVGIARNVKGDWATVVDLSGKGGAANWVIVYPVDGQMNVPLAFPGKETPNPLPDAKTDLGGYPITVQFSPGLRVADVKATLRNAAGEEIDVWLSSPQKPANPQFVPHQRNAICLIAKEVLKPTTRYTVNVSAKVDGTAWSQTWSFQTDNDSSAAEPFAPQAVKRINFYRSLAGLQPIRVRADWSKECQAHARYLAINIDRPRSPSLNFAEEDPDLPGYSVGGHQVARKAIVSLGMTAPAVADWYVADYLNRAIVLDPRLREIGLGAAKSQQRGWIAVLDFVRGQEGPAAASVVVFPANGQKDVPLVYPSMSAIKPAPAGGVAGYAVSVIAPNLAAANVSARLTDASKQEIEVWLSTPGSPAVKKINQNSICLIPKKPLQPKTTYTVSVRATIQSVPWKKVWHFTTADAVVLAGKGGTAAAVLRSLNACRSEAGLQPVRLDAELSKGCLAHARYLVKNDQHPSTRGMGKHNEDAKLPGYSKEGEAAGRASEIANLREPTESVSVWISTLYHRLDLLHPDLRRIGFGQSQLPTGGWVCVLNDKSGRESDRAILYPANRQRNVPRASSEREAGGFPITVTFSPRTRVGPVRATLKDAAGKTVPCRVSSPEKGGIRLLPEERLQAKTVYAVHIAAEVNGKEWVREWTFTTAGE